MIVAVTAEGERIAKPAGAWAAGLPDIGESAGEDVRTAHVRARMASGMRSVHYEGAFLGRIEELGATVEGELTLTRTSLRFEAEGAPPREWPLDAITGVQPSSSTLQIKLRGEPVISFRFVDQSARFWEETLRGVLRAYYRDAGRGDVLEFQPRVVLG